MRLARQHLFSRMPRRLAWFVRFQWQQAALHIRTAEKSKMSSTKQLFTLAFCAALGLTGNSAHAQGMGDLLGGGLFGAGNTTETAPTPTSSLSSSPFGSTFMAGYPVFFWNYGTYRAYERMEKRVFRSRALRELYANYLDAAQSRYALKNMNREYRESRKAPRVTTINLQVSPEPIVSASELVSLLYKPAGPPEWPAVFLYKGFDNERLQLQQLLALENLDQSGLQFAAKLLVRLESKLREYRDGDVVVTPGDYLAGRRFLANLNRQMVQAPANSPAPANAVAAN